MTANSSHFYTNSSRMYGNFFILIKALIKTDCRYTHTFFNLFYVYEFHIMKENKNILSIQRKSSGIPCK